VSERQAAVGRWQRAARVAGITSVGAALMALLQVTDPLGLTLLFNLGAPEMAFSVTAGGTFLAFAALLEWLALALAGSLVTWPIAHLSTFIILSIVTSYLIYGRQELGRLWIWIQVPVLADFYMVALQPEGLGADNIQMFAGLTLAIVLLLLCNRVLWPRPAAITLGESTAAMLEGARRRLRTLRAHLTGHDTAGEWNGPRASQLGFHLSLLGPAIRQAPTLADAAEMLLRVIGAERIREEIEKEVMAITALDQRLISTDSLTELAELGEVVERLLEENENRAKAPATDREYDRPATGTRATTEQAIRLAAAEPSIAPATELLARIAEILALDPLEQPPKEASWPAERRRPDAVANRFLVRFSIRHTLALTIAFLIGLWANAPALHAALWLLMLGGPPSHGATARKFTMRALAAAGALSVAAAAAAVIEPNFGSLGPYAIAIFAGTLPLAYAGESGGIVSFLGIGGTAFVIAYSGPGPRPDLVGSIWTIWGISLGMIIRAAVSALWPERPGRTLAEQFQAPLESILTLLTGDTKEPPGAEATAQAEQQLIYGVEQILAVADDARLQGGSATVDGTALIAVADTLLRIGFLVGNVKSLQKEYSLPHIRSEIEYLRRNCASWLDYLRTYTDSGSLPHAPLRAMVLHARSAGLDLSPDALTEMHGMGTHIRLQTKADGADKLKFLLETLFNRFEWQITHIARDLD
jgi:hypothetical protein